MEEMDHSFTGHGKAKAPGLSGVAKSLAPRVNLLTSPSLWLDPNALLDTLLWGQLQGTCTPGGTDSSGGDNILIYATAGDGGFAVHAPNVLGGAGGGATRVFSGTRGDNSVGEFVGSWGAADNSNSTPLLGQIQASLGLSGDNSSPRGSGALACLHSMALLLAWAAGVAATDGANKGVTLMLGGAGGGLSPGRQRGLLPGLLGIMGGFPCPLRVIAATLEPLVMASMEAHFDPGQDAWFELGRSAKGKLSVKRREFTPWGTVDNWLTSPVFGLEESRSLEGEHAVGRAKGLMLLRGEDISREEVVEVDKLLREEGARIPESDPFMAHRWGYFRDRVLSPPPPITRG